MISKVKKIITAVCSLWILAGMTVFTSCSDDDHHDTVKKSPVVLVHGAWQGDYAWEEVKNGLVGRGYDVTVVALAGHGADNTPVSGLTFSGYVSQVKLAVTAFDEPVILVGHSLGGALITQAAAEIPGKIKKLVYVAGFIPASGKSVLDYSMLDPASLLGPVLEFNAEGSLAGLVNPEINFPNVFCQDGTPQQKQFLLEHYKPEAVAPLATPLSYQASDYQSAGSKYYIYTKIDNAISLGFQQQMAADAGITATYTIDAGHSPFISKPGELTVMLSEIFNKQ